LLESNWDFQKSVPELFSKMVTLQVEYSIKQKALHLQSCREFYGKRSGHKIQLIPSPNGQVSPDLVRPKMGRWESERLYKGRNPSSWGTPPPTNLQPPEPRFCFLHRSHLHGGGLPWSHEGRGLRGGAPPWCRRRGSPPRRRRRRPRPSLLISAIFTTISITNSSYYAVAHPPTHHCTVLCKHGVWCYNIYPMIYVMFAYFICSWIDLLNVFGSLELYVDMVLSFGVHYIYVRMD
jgi:hypothetical protein